MIDVDGRRSVLPFTVREPTGGDLSAITRLFVAAFEAHPIAALSRKLQHKFIAAHAEERAIFVAADRHFDVIGFAIAGSCEQLDRARRTFLHGNVVPLALHALRRRGTYLRMPSRTARAERTSPGAAHELRYIAVAPSAQRAGVASALIASLEREMFVSEAYYVWAVAQNADAMGFYLRRGFREELRSNGHVRLIKDGR